MKLDDTTDEDEAEDASDASVGEVMGEWRRPRESIHRSAKPLLFNSV